MRSYNALSWLRITNKFTTKLAANRHGLHIYDFKPFTNIAFGGHKNTESGSAGEKFKNLLDNLLMNILRTENINTAPHDNQLSEADRSYTVSEGVELPATTPKENVNTDILIDIDISGTLYYKKSHLALI